MGALGENYTKNWHAYDMTNGKKQETPLPRVNFVHMAIAVPPGYHKYEIRYMLRRYVIGKCNSLRVLALLVSWMAYNGLKKLFLRKRQK